MPFSCFFTGFSYVGRGMVVALLIHQTRILQIRRKNTARKVKKFYARWIFKQHLGSSRLPSTPPKK
jgi:hypothetical protein